MPALLLAIAIAVAMPPVMPVDQVARGQQGQCRTVFEGDTIEAFPFVVKGVMRGFLGPGRDLVLVRLLGDKTEFTGVVAGMSGSPCTVNGKLLGALAYAFGTFAKEPIAGITPMDSMLDVTRLPAQPVPWRIRHPDDATAAADWDALRRGRASPLAARLHPKAAHDLQPIATPLSMGGVLPAVRAHFDPWLRSVGFEPVAGSVGGGRRGGSSLVPGSAVAAVLVRGDVEVAATGTVTWVDDGRVLAFGHPFFGAGVVSIPMASAHIINTMVTQMRSYKMSLVGKTLGEITEDRLTAVGGVIGRRAAMIPVRGTIDVAGKRESYGFEVARDVGLSPRFLAIAVANALSGRVVASARGTVRLKAEMKVRGIEPVRLNRVYSSQRDASLPVYAAMDVGQVMATLWSTPFGPPPEMEISVQTAFEPEPLAEWVEALHLDRPRVRPGEQLDLAVRLRRDDGPVGLERFSIRVPRSWAGQTVQIVATGAAGAEKLEHEVEGNPRPKDLAQVGRWLSRRRAGGQLYVMAVRSGPGMTSEVQSLPHLPPSVVATISGDPTKQVRHRGLAWEDSRPRPGVVMGTVGTTIKVLDYPLR